MKRILAISFALLLAACASYSGSGLIAGESGMDDVIRAMGKPSMQWTQSDGTRSLAYPRGPMGVHTYMVLIGANGKLQHVENVMDPRLFLRIDAGMSKDRVLRMLGPPDPSRTIYFEARDELVWDWLYCDEWNKLAHFSVLFDGTKETVRSTLSIRVKCGPKGDDCWCSH
ncbi:MAG: hypothetical protein A2045_06555 [Rhodocyclales bacterium GWA2_65_20]|nr:MAG: hypothetical protein A2045_06555 [Rhodocyclales bacterium GWA2_65_20]